MLIRYLNYFLLSLLILPMPLWALSSDKDQPIQLEADQVEIDDKTGVSIYTGNVKFVQGSIVVTADKVKIYMEKRDLKRIISFGQPATFKQTPDDRKGDIHGRSKKMEYVAKSDLLILTHQAKLWQNQDVFEGERIEYDRINAKIKAGSLKTKKTRIKAVIQPSKK